MGLWLVAPLALAGDAAGQNEPFTPVHLAIVDLAQLPPRDVPVYGVAVSVIGGQDEVKGFAIGFLNQVGNLDGFSGGAVNLVGENANGIQFGTCNNVDGELRGIQAMGLLNHVGELSGAQLGAVNVTQKGRGLQLGLVNVTKSLRGVQIGLLNFNPEGFLPFFPLINFNF